MSIKSPRRAALAAGVLFACSISAIAQTQTAATPVAEGADIVLTPGRGPEAVARSGSSITIVRADDIEKAGIKSTADLFRALPGVSVTENGGAGQAATLRLRGAESRHTLVLIDGVRVNDPAGGNEFDFNALVPADVERIEVLRGPQSALYGSDAMGGVINIITRKGRGEQRGFVSLEGGSYGMLSGRAGISGGTRDFDYAISIGSARMEGFSAFGYRIGRITRNLARPLETDTNGRIGGSAKFSWRPAEGVEIEAGLTSTYTRAGYDAAYGALPDTVSTALTRFTNAYVKGSFLLLDGKLKNAVTVFGNISDRNYNDFSYLDFGGGPVRMQDKYDYLGQRVGVEYQGDLNLDRFGKLTFGARYEHERLRVDVRPIENSFNSPSHFTAQQNTRSVFALHQLPIGERFDLSLGGRIDSIEGGDHFATWRATAAYRLPTLGTKLRASVGTGAKAPTLFQKYSPQYGAVGLTSERSLGYDIGFDQALLNGRVNLSVTAFHNKFNNLIDFSTYDVSTYTYPICPPGQAYSGCYINVGRAETKGVEISADAVLIEGLLKARGTYTYLDARDQSTGMRLARRPQNEGRIALRWTPTDKLALEASLHLVGQRFSSANEVYRLAPYARLDLRADYQVHKNLNLYLRGENLTNARYQEVYNYGTTGRAVYAGARASW